MSAIPDDIWEAARSLRNAVNWASNESVEIIANALLAEREAERERSKAHWLGWHQKRSEISRKFWLRAAKAALSGDLRELSNRVALCEAEPLELVLSGEEGE